MADGGLIMKFRITGITAALAAMSACMMLLSGCTNEPAEPEETVTSEEWAYIYDAGTTVLELKSNGQAIFEGVDYTYTLSDNILSLTDKAGKVTEMRFIPDGDQMLLYETAVYQYQGEGAPDGVIGNWKQVGGNLAFEFTDKGTFREDYYSPGRYTIDEENGIIKLVYNDMYEDTYIYYSVEGDILSVDYPWPVVKTEKTEE